MPTDETKAILDHHNAMLDAGDVDGIMEDYTEDSVFISNLGGVAKGLEAIRGVFAMSAGTCRTSSSVSSTSTATSPSSPGRRRASPWAPTPSWSATARSPPRPSSCTSA